MIGSARWYTGRYHTNKWYISNQAPVKENNTKTPIELWHKYELPHLGQKSRTINKKKTCKIVGFAVLADHKIKLKECEKKDKYLDFARELKKNGAFKWQL